MKAKFENLEAGCVVIYIFVDLAALMSACFAIDNNLRDTDLN